MKKRKNNLGKKRPILGITIITLCPDFGHTVSYFSKQYILANEITRIKPMQIKVKENKQKERFQSLNIGIPQKERMDIIQNLSQEYMSVAEIHY